MTVNGAGPINVSVPALGPGNVQGPRKESTTPAPQTPAASHRPDGANPHLWELLTGEEQAFFSQIEHIGPVTYAPPARRASQPSPPVGQRLDVRG